MFFIKYQKFIFHLIIICIFIRLSWLRTIDKSTVEKKNHNNSLNNHIRIESKVDSSYYDEYKNETIFESEKIPVKYWNEKKKVALQKKIENEIDYNVDAVTIAVSEEFRFYNQLNSNEKQIYDILYTNSKQEPPSLKILISFTNVTDLDSFIDELIISAEKIFTVLSYENPELWWIGTYQFYIVSSSIKNQYIVTFDMLPDYSTFYGYSSEEIMALNQEVENVKYEIMNNIASYNITTPYAILRYIHDYLITNIIYILDEDKKHIRTLYGALVEKECVCEGYSEAFQYLAHQYGINCITARSSTHEWNFVEMKGKWYVVDLTYDDPLVNGENTPLGSDKNLKIDFFLTGTENNSPDYSKYSEDPNHVLIYSGFSDKELVSYPIIEENNYIPTELEINEIKSMGLPVLSNSILYIERPHYNEKNKHTSDGLSIRNNNIFLLYNLIMMVTCIYFFILN
jgi:hypothetical protein